MENFEPQKSHEIQILTSVAKFDPKNAAKLNFTQCDLIIYEKYGQAKMLGSPGTALKKKSKEEICWKPWPNKNYDPK